MSLFGLRLVYPGRLWLFVELAGKLGSPTDSMAVYQLDERSERGGRRNERFRRGHMGRR